jgi:putative flippase GtrA
MSSISARIGGRFNDRVNSLRGQRAAREFKRFIKFGIVGVSGFIVDFTVLNALIFLAGLPYWAANTFSFAAGVADTFTLNRLWTIPESRKRPLKTQLLQFVGIYLVGWVINEAVFLGTNAALWSHMFPQAVAVNLAKASASGVALFWNFTANRLWTWRGL